jgi:hypothetical protein
MTAITYYLLGGDGEDAPHGVPGQKDDPQKSDPRESDRQE